MSYILDAANWQWTDQNSIGRLLLDHPGLTGLSMLIALLIAFPLSLVAARYPRVYLPVITAALSSWASGSIPRAMRPARRSSPAGALPSSSWLGELTKT